jgi:hypothetical protein
VVALELRPPDPARRPRAGIDRHSLHDVPPIGSIVVGIATPEPTLAEELYQAAREQGYGQKGTHALIVALAARSGVDPSLGRT